MDMSILGSLIAHSKQIQCTSLIKDHFEGISDISVSPFNEYKACAACFDKTLTEYDINKSTQICRLTGHESGIWTCDYSPIQDGLVATGSSDSTIKLWDIHSQQCINTLKNHDKSIYDVQFSTDGKYLGSCSKETICIYDTKNYKEPLEIIEVPTKNPDNGFIYCLNFTENNKSIVTGFIDGTIFAHRIGTGIEDDIKFHLLPNYIETYKEDEEYSKCVYSLAKFHMDDSKIMLSHSDGSVRIYEMDLDSRKMKLKDQFYYFTSPVTCSDSSSDDKMIIACGKDRSCEIWNIDTHKEIKYTLSGHTGVISACHFVKNGKNDIVITGSYDNTIRIWNLKKAQ